MRQLKSYQTSFLVYFLLLFIFNVSFSRGANNQANTHLQKGVTALSIYLETLAPSDYKNAKDFFEMAAKNPQFSKPAKVRLILLDSIKHARTSFAVVNKKVIDGQTKGQAKSGDYEGAVETIIEACLTAPNQITYSGHYQSYFEKANKLSEFKVLLMIALKNQPSNFRARYMLARQYVLEGNKDKAYTLYDEYLSEVPGDIKTLVNYAVIAYDACDWPKAIEIYTKVVVAEPKQYHHYSKLGLCYQYLGDTQSARASFQKAVQVAKSSAPKKNIVSFTCRVLAKFEYQYGAFEDALRWYKEALKYSEKGSSPSIHISLANIYKKTGQVEAAMYHMEKAIVIQK